MRIINKRKIGATYESIAAFNLKKAGYEIIEMNYRCRFGEIDIVAQHGAELIFCEVKYRKNAKYGYPEEAVDYNKQKIISKVASFYLKEHNIEFSRKISFCVVSVLGDKVSIIKNAFWGI